MRLHSLSLPPRRRGSVIIGTLFFILIISILLMGIGQYAVSHQTRGKVDTDYATALSLAEAGVNFEMGRISANPADADQSPGVTYSFGGGTFQVRCVQRNANGTETTPWTAPEKLYVYATGTYHGVSRDVKVSVKGYGVQGNFAVYGIHSVDLGSNSTIIGDVGSNGSIIKGTSCSISGNVYLNGAAATYTGSGTPIRNPFPLVWPTVDQIANTKFPSGGLAWLATHNDNARVGIINNQITGTIRLVGPGNYYVTNVSLSGNREIIFDNTDGPVSLWVGPSGGAGAVSFRGTTDGITDPNQGGNQVNIYIATAGDATLDMRGNSTIRANVYAYNRYPNGGAEYGTIHMGGTPDVYGTILGYNVDFNGTPGVMYVNGVEQPEMIGYFGYDNSWIELNRR